ncbi:hypothetical protein [Streptomyces sp. NPDC046332]|uniref:hypothetical protein n=1 Tax=Streptomyces sp. NPDC046332 TaxID=3155133 RepID=UPI0033D9B0C7
MAPLADGPYEIPRAVDQLLHRGWLRTDAGQRLYLTDAGEAARVRQSELVTELRAVVPDGSTTRSTWPRSPLRRMISHVEAVRKP